MRKYYWMRFAPALLICLLASSASAQILLDSTEDLAWDRPEAWAMRFFTSVSLMGDYTTATETEPGAITVALETSWVPHLSEDQRRVGFIGSKVEDLNRTTVFGRLRVGFQLPAHWDLTLGYVPPLEIDGVRPELLSISLGRPLWRSPTWSLAGRVDAQAGSLRGDLTCPANVVGSSDPEVNPDGCLEPSDDEVTMDYVGGGLTWARTGGGRWQPYVDVAASYFDLEFQVSARFAVFEDRKRLFAEGWQYSLAVGTRIGVPGPFEMAAELFYAPMEVVRDPLSGTESDPLVTARLLVEYRLR